MNFVCHATTNPGGISANYIAYVEKAIRGMFGEQVVVVFLAGASGDVTQVDNLSLDVPKRGAAMTALVGGRVGAEAVKVLLGMTTGTSCPIAVRSETLRMPRRQPRPEHLAEAKALIKLDPREAGQTNWIFAKELVLLEALQAVKPGVPCREVDAVARSIISDAGFGEYFGHGLGHGVGLEVHEAPRLNKQSEAILEEGMAVTVEPGIYLPGKGGVRIEDLVLVTRDGCEVLTQIPKELTVLCPR